MDYLFLPLIKTLLHWGLNVTYLSVGLKIVQSLIQDVRLCQTNQIYRDEAQIPVMAHSTLWLVGNIVFQDQQANAELAKIMGEFTESGDQSPSVSNKGDDLLAMMDGLWHGHSDRNGQGLGTLHCQQFTLVKTSLLSVPANALQQNHMQPEKLLARVLLQSRCEQFCCQTISCIFAFKNKECVVRQALSCNSMFAVNAKVFRFNVQLAYCILVYWPCDNSKTSVYTVQYLAVFILFYVIFFKFIYFKSCNDQTVLVHIQSTVWWFFISNYSPFELYLNLHRPEKKFVTSSVF